MNPNYDYDKLKKEYDSNKVAQEVVEEEPVKLKGEEVKEGEDK